MLIDAHTHILSLAEDAEFTTEYGREGSLCIYRSLGKLPAHRMPDRGGVGGQRLQPAGFPVIGPGRVGPRPPGLRQDRDPGRVAAVPGRRADRHGRQLRDHRRARRRRRPEKCNDYIAAIVASQPDVFIGYASVNPAYRGPAGGGARAGAGRDRARAAGPQAVPDVPGLVPGRPGARLPGVREGRGARHPGHGPPGRLDPDRRPDGVRPARAARRGRAALPRPAADDRALRPALGRRGACSC